MGYRLTLASEVGVGSTFTVWLDGGVAGIPGSRPASVAEPEERLGNKAP
jgi:hypothetical protein